MKASTSATITFSTNLIAVGMIGTYALDSMLEQKEINSFTSILLGVNSLFSIIFYANAHYLRKKEQAVESNRELYRRLFPELSYKLEE